MSQPGHRQPPARSFSLSDPGVRAVGVLVLLILGGFATLYIAWHGAEHAVYVPLQLPWVLSGGLAGLAMIGVGAGALSIHVSRRDDAIDRAGWDEFTRVAAELTENLRTAAVQQPVRSRPARRR